MEEIFLKIQELEKLRGIPQFLFMSPIDEPHSFDIREKILKFKEGNPHITEIDLIVESPGGSPDEAYRIIRTFRNNFEIVNTVIPFWAKSAATLLSLGGNNIIMDEFAEFGPLDIQLQKASDDGTEINPESALNDESSLQRIETRSQELYQTMFISLYNNTEIHISKNELSKQILKYLSDFYMPILRQINPYQLGDKKRKLEIGERYAERILTQYVQDINEIDKLKLIDFFINGCPDHGYIIDYPIISKYLPNVKKSDEYGEAYKKALAALSGEFVYSESRYIGFVISDSNKQRTPSVVGQDNIEEVLEHAINQENNETFDNHPNEN